jgi:hypothetical protein
MMNSQASPAFFIFKLFLWSTGLSLLVKYGGGYLGLQPNITTVLTIVLMPSLLLGLILGWRYNQV